MGVIEPLHNRARNLRKRLTDAETLLWNHLRMKQVEGYKFRRQQPIDRYIVDFVCFEKRLIIEVDGGQHASERKKDSERDRHLKNNEFKVLRFWNNEVFTNIEGVLEVISINLETPSPTPPPVEGGGNIRGMPPLAGGATNIIPSPFTGEGVGGGEGVSTGMPE